MRTLTLRRHSPLGRQWLLLAGKQCHRAALNLVGSSTSSFTFSSSSSSSSSSGVPRLRGARAISTACNNRGLTLRVKCGPQQSQRGHGPVGGGREGVFLSSSRAAAGGGAYARPGAIPACAPWCSRPLLSFGSRASSGSSSRSGESNSSSSSSSSSPSSPDEEISVNLDSLAAAEELSLVQELRWRGLIAQHSASSDSHLDEFLSKSFSSGSRSHGSAKSHAKCGVYAGFDPTANSLHVGNMVPLVVLAHCLRRGHRAVALIGGATGLIGDPTGRVSERPMLELEAIRRNSSHLAVQLSTLLGSACDGSVGRTGLVENMLKESVATTETVDKSVAAAELSSVGSVGEGWMGAGLEFHVVDNLDWQGTATVPGFLRDVGRFFRVKQLLAKEALASRMRTGNSDSGSDSGGGGAKGDEGLSFAELAYPLLQASDFAHLHASPEYQCGLQVGGSDQWGNISAGCSFISRTARQHRVAAAAAAAAADDDVDDDDDAGESVQEMDPAHGLTTPLLTTADGAKLGKSTGGGGVWLSPTKTSPFELFQYFMKLTDGDACRLLRLLTFIPPRDIVKIEQLHGTAPEARMAQLALAYEIVAFVHGVADADQARRASVALFRGAATGADGAGFSSARLRALLDLASGAAGDASSPSTLVALPRDETVGAPLARLFVASGLCKSMKEAKNLHREGGLYVNDVQVQHQQDQPGTVAVLEHDALLRLEEDDEAPEERQREFVVLRRGKKHYRVVELLH